MEEINTAKTENQVKLENVASRIEKTKEEEQTEPEKINENISDITVRINDEQEKINTVTQKINEIRNELGLQGTENNFPSTDYNKNKITKLESKRTSLKEALLKIGKIAAISVIGIMPGKLNGQDTIKNAGIETRIENNEQLKSQIFNEVDVALKNGLLKNKPDNSYLFEFKNGNYDISYNLDTNGDGEKDLKPQISVSYDSGNSYYELVKGQNEISNIDKDIVYNYKDDSLSNSETKPYGDFGRENLKVIPELYGKENSPVHFRKINKEEIEKFLNDIKQFSGIIDYNGIEQNNINIKNKEEKDNILKKESEEKKNALELQMIPFVDIYNFLKQNINNSQINHNEGDYSHFVKGGYSCDFDDTGYLKVSFVDKDGYKNLITANLGKSDFGIRQALKIKKNEEGSVVSRENMSEEQISKIIKDVLLDIKNY